jgi:hypothetical protein
METFMGVLWVYAMFGAFLFLVVFLMDRRRRKKEQAAHEARMEEIREDARQALSRKLRAANSRSSTAKWNDGATERHGRRASHATSPAPHPDYLDQHLIWQNLSASTPEAAEDWHPPTYSASAPASGGGGDFGGGGASSSWESSSSSDSGSSSSSDSSSSSSSD